MDDKRINGWTDKNVLVSALQGAGNLEKIKVVGYFHP
jgi:hypothetical protein